MSRSLALTPSPSTNVSMNSEIDGPLEAMMPGRYLHEQPCVQNQKSCSAEAPQLVFSFSMHGAT